jgi:hypothetical protein
MFVISDFKALQRINAMIQKSKALSPSSLVSVGHWRDGVEGNSMCGKFWGNSVTMKMEALCYSETFKNFITTQIRNPNEDCHLNNNRCEKLTGQKWNYISEIQCTLHVFRKFVLVNPTTRVSDGYWDKVSNCNCLQFHNSFWETE